MLDLVLWDTCLEMTRLTSGTDLMREESAGGTPLGGYKLSLASGREERRTSMGCGYG
jgi:hypothetical protein